VIFNFEAVVPLFSENVAGVVDNVNAVSLSLTVTAVVVGAKPSADAVIVTDAAPSTVELSTAAISTSTKVWPARIVAVAGTVALLVLEDVNVTT
jgi:hypothetical protein